MSVCEDPEVLDAARWLARYLHANGETSVAGVFIASREAGFADDHINHALANERLTRTDCPIKAVRVAKRDDPADKRRPFRDDEATMVLNAARSETKASMRWLPILLAFTGTRLDELCGASKADIRSDAQAGWYIRKDRLVRCSICSIASAGDRRGLHQVRRSAT